MRSLSLGRRDKLKGQVGLLGPLNVFRTTIDIRDPYRGEEAPKLITLQGCLSLLQPSQILGPVC